MVTSLIDSENQTTQKQALRPNMSILTLLSIYTNSICPHQVHMGPAVNNVELFPQPPKWLNSKENWDRKHSWKSLEFAWRIIYNLEQNSRLRNHTIWDKLFTSNANSLGPHCKWKYDMGGQSVRRTQPSWLIREKSCNHHTFTEVDNYYQWGEGIEVGKAIKLQFIWSHFSMFGPARWAEVYTQQLTSKLWMYEWNSFKYKVLVKPQLEYCV